MATGSVTVQNLYADILNQGSAGTGIAVNHNLVFPNGTGLDFNATQSTATGVTPSSSAVLDDYEEGTWAIDDSSSSVAVSNKIGRYVKIGNQVTVYGSFDMPSTSNTTLWIALGLPFSRAENTSSVSATCGVMNATGGYNGCVAFYSTSTTTFLFLGNNDSPLNPSDLSSKNIRFTITYRTT